MEFSYDNQFVVGVSCDDYHMVGIFNLLNGDRVCEVHGQKGEHNITFNTTLLHLYHPCYNLHTYPYIL